MDDAEKRFPARDSLAGIREEVYRQMRDSILNSKPIFPSPIMNTSKCPVESGSFRRDLIKRRLSSIKVEGAEYMPDFLETTLQGETVFVFTVAQGKPVTLEDDVALFPSDTLITQLRLLFE